jgi:hypothetical protein
MEEDQFEVLSAEPLFILENNPETSMYAVEKKDSLEDNDDILHEENHPLNPVSVSQETVLEKKNQFSAKKEGKKPEVLLVTVFEKDRLFKRASGFPQTILKVT